MSNDELKEKLEGEKKDLEEQLVVYSMEDPLLGPDKDPAHNLEDSPTEAEGHERVVVTKRELKQRLREVEDALDRIQKEDFGKCKNCGEMVSKERLEVLPTAKYCLECENKFE
jgi:RNA polymerase-binding transcription factor DksA